MKEVFYIIEVNNNVEREPQIAFYNKKEAEKFLKMKGYSNFDGHNGWKIQKNVDNQSVDVFSSVKEYLSFKNAQQTRRLRKFMIEEASCEEME